MATFFERLELIVDANVAGAVKGLGLTGAQAATLDKQAKGLGSSFPIVAAGALALGAGAVFAADKFADLGVSVRQFRDVAGTSADTASRWVAVLDDYGIAADVGAKSVGKFGREIANGGDTLRKYGVDIVRAKDGSVDMQGTLLNLADAYNGMQDPASKSALLMAAFGRQGQQLIPILEQGRDGIRQMFADVPDKQLLSDSDLDKAREFKLAVDNLQDAFMEIGIVVGRVVSGPLSLLTDTIAIVSRGAAELGGSFGGSALQGAAFGAAIGSIIPGVGTLTGALIGGGAGLISGLGDSSKAAREAATEFYNASPLFAGLAVNMEQSNQAAQRSAEKHRESAAGIREEIAALQGAALALATKTGMELAAQGSMQGVEFAQRAVNDALEKYGPFSLEARAAQTNLEAATLKAAEANKGNMQSLITLRDQVPSLRGEIQAYIDALNRIPRDVRTIINAEKRGTVLGFGAFLPETAEGGIFSGAQARVIGEAGPEAVIPLNNPRRAQQIMNEAGLVNAMAVRGGGGTTHNVHLNVSVPVGADPADAGRHISYALDAYYRRIGRNN